MNLMHQHEHHTLTIDTNNNRRQGYNNGVNIKLYTSGVQQLLQKSSRILFTSHGRVTT